MIFNPSIFPESTVKYYTIAANQGHGMAIHNLAFCHRNGIDTPVNKVEVLRLFKISADKEDDNSFLY